MEKQKNHNFYFGRIILSLIIATILFVGVFTFGYYIAYLKLGSVYGDEQVLLNSFLELQLEKELIQSSCSNFDISMFSEDLNNMGSFMGLIEQKLGKNDPTVLEQKKIYTMLQVQHLLLIEEQNKKCNQNTQVLLFFYSNKNEYVDSAEEMGYIISSFKQLNNNLAVYSFDYDLNMTLINTLKKVNSVSKPNTIIYNGEQIYDLQNIDDLVNLQEKNQNNLSSDVISLN